jgi:hypothetical protein
VVEQSGIVKAEVQVRNCVIAGVVVGNVTATESVEITKEGRMVGDIAAPRVIIVDGASFRGRIDMGEVDVGRGEHIARPVARPAPRPALRAPPARGGKKEEAKAKVEEKTLPSKPPAPPPAVGMGAVKRKVVVRRK